MNYPPGHYQLSRIKSSQPLGQTIVVQLLALLLCAPPAVLAQSPTSTTPSPEPAATKACETPATKVQPSTSQTSITTTADAPSSTPQTSSTKPARDPLAIYRQAGINSDQESQILRLVKDAEEADSVRLQAISNLLHEMLTLSLQPTPEDESLVAKQDQINKLTAEMATERIKLLLKIRHLLTPEQKQRLVELMQQKLTGSN